MLVLQKGCVFTLWIGRQLKNSTLHRALGAACGSWVCGKQHLPQGAGPRYTAYSGE